MRSIEHSHTIVKIVQNVVFTSHAVMMTLNKIDEIPPWPHNFVRLSRQPQGSSRPAFFMCRPLKSYSSYFIVSIMPHLSSASLTKNVVSCMILHFSILFFRLISISHKLKCVMRGNKLLLNRKNVIHECMKQSKGIMLSL